MSEREDYIKQSSLDVRQEAAGYAMAALAYHNVLHGEAMVLHRAGTWILQHAGVNTSELLLDDDEYIKEKQKGQITAIHEKVDEAEKIETWAAALFDHRDSPDVIALKSLVIFEDLNFRKTEKEPKRMVAFEAKIIKEQQKLDELKAQEIELDKAIETKEGLDSVDLSEATKAVRLSMDRPVTAVKLAVKQQAIVIAKIREVQEHLSNKKGIIETLRAGNMNEWLREQVLELNPRAYSSTPK